MAPQRPISDHICPEHSGIVKELKAINEKIDLMSQFQERSVGLAKQELERRLEAMNDFRTQIDRQAKQFVTREELTLKLDKMETKLEILQNVKSETTGERKWMNHIITALIGMATVIGVWIIVRSP